ncbi:NAD(P)/FAD-dependent oxidoreductase [Propionibacteriaceae bacterium Y1685]
MRVLVVGASAAGLTTVEALRADGFDGALTMVGDEVHLPYDRPPLSKSTGDGPGAGPPLLRPADRFAELDLDLRLGVRATALDVVGHRVELSDGTMINYGKLVIATGVHARPLDLGPGVEVHTLRTHDDAVHLLTAADRARRVLVIGAGFLGTEVAATLATHGRSVTLVDRGSAPMINVLGPEAAEAVADLHRSHGVDLRSAVTVAEVAPSAEGHRFVLSDGSQVTADCVVAAIGSVPTVDWLAGSDLDLANGVVCDDRLRAAEDVYAAGDVAAWRTGDGEVRRVEHRMNATEQGMLVARNVLGADQPHQPVPYFWTDQYDCKVQAYGFPHTAAVRQVLSGDLTGGRWVVAHGRAGKLVGAVGCISPREMIKVRRMLASGTDWSELV